MCRARQSMAGRWSAKVVIDRLASRPRNSKQAAERRGRGSEAIAALWLRLKGHRILGRRIKTRAGEIDLVSLAPFGPVCFIEVKARALARDAAEAVGPE